MVESLGEMKKWRRERIEKGSHCFSSPQVMTSWSSSIKIYKLIECVIKKKNVMV